MSTVAFFFNTPCIFNAMRSLTYDEMVRWWPVRYWVQIPFDENFGGRERQFHCQTLLARFRKFYDFVDPRELVFHLAVICILYHLSDVAGHSPIRPVHGDSAMSSSLLDATQTLRQPA